MHRATKEIEVGGTPYFSIPNQLFQMGSLYHLITENIGDSPLLKRTCLAIIPLQVCAAAALTGDLQRILPSFLRHEKGMKALQTFAKENSTLWKVTAVATYVYALYMGSPVPAIAALATFAYHECYDLGLIPSNIASQVKDAMILCGIFLSLTTDFGWMRCVTIVQICLRGYELLSRQTGLLRDKSDTFTYRFVPSRSQNDIPLAQFSKPFCPPTDFTSEQIDKILRSDLSTLSFAPEHCSQLIQGIEEIPEDPEFSFLLKKFDELNWGKESLLQVVKAKLKDDDRFIEQLCIKNSTLDRTQIRQTIELYSPEELKSCARSSLEHLVTVLQTKRGVGIAQDLEIAQTSFSKVVHLLKANRLSEIDTEDCLLQCAIEGGPYCNTQLKDVSRTIAERFSSHAELSYGDQLLLALQDERKKSIQAWMRQSVFGLWAKENVHNYETIKNTLAVGFVSIPSHNIDSEDALSLFLLAMCRYLRSTLVSCYRKNLIPCLNEAGGVLVCDYLRQKIGENSKLSETEKETLIERLADGSEFENFQKLALVMLGVIRYPI
ncbi:MAG: hypothetical protein KGI80_05260 [Verrucomicrobiota bacterium]|nr:hypothetical protein [Verrucomicrobiota bacterium]